MSEAAAKLPEAFQRKIRFTPAFDRRSEGYGVHGVDVVFDLLHAPTRSGVSFQVFSGWMLPSVPGSHHACGASVDIHSPAPLYDHSPECTAADCLITGGECWSDGSGLFANEVFAALVAGGDDAVWPLLVGFWERWRADHD